MRVSGSSTASPSRAVSRLRNSTAPSESSPASISGASADTLGRSSDATSLTVADVCTVVLLFTAITGAWEACAVRSPASALKLPSSTVVCNGAGSSLGAVAVGGPDTYSI